MVNYIKNTIDLSAVRLSDSYYYNSLAFCIIDAIFSIGAKYESTKNVVLRYCDKNNLEMYRDRNIPITNIEHEYTVAEFLRNTNGISFDDLASIIFENKQRTSTSNGILKAQAVYEFASILHNNNIDTFSDVPKMYENFTIETQVKAIKGQRSGISVDYFYMLSGNDDLIKADRHILNYIYMATGYRVSKDKAQKLIANSVEVLKLEYPEITCRMLDHAIWNYMAHK